MVICAEKPDDEAEGVTKSLPRWWVVEMNKKT